MTVLGNVKKVLERENAVIVSIFDGRELCVDLPDDPPPISNGDTILITDSKEYIRKVSDERIDAGNRVGVVEAIVDDIIIVDTKGIIRTVTNPEGYEISEGYTVELTEVYAIDGVIKKQPLKAITPPSESTDIDKIVSTFRQKSDDISVGFDDYGGMSEEIQRFQERVQLFLRSASNLEEVGVKSRTGAIFYGPPGTGKTHFARIIAGETEATFYSIRGPEIVTKWVGDTEEIIRGLFDDAEANEPSIIYFDEIDSLGSERSSQGSQNFGNRVVAQLLSILDGFDQEDHSIMVIASTNRLDDIDDALLRPGRFDLKIHFETPTAEERESILEVLSKDYRISDEVQLETLAESTEGWTGADLERLLDEAGMVCVSNGRNRIEWVDVLESWEIIDAQRKQIGG